MPRTLSWLDRIVPISRVVQESARSHYDRRDIERLFELQPRAAQQLMAALPSISVGRAKLVERDALTDFLLQLNREDEPAAAFAKMKTAGGKTVRRKLRNLTLQDYSANVQAPPAVMTLSRGELRVKFANLEELAEAMLWMATVLRDDLQTFAEEYEPEQISKLAEEDDWSETVSDTGEL